MHLTFEKMNNQEKSNIEKKEEMFNIMEEKKKILVNLEQSSNR